jgi:hypothetical protein
MIEESVINMLIPLGFFALVFGVVYIRSRENMALIERGINPRQTGGQPKPFISLKYGLLLLGSGLGLLVAYLLDGMMDHTKVTPAGTSYQSDQPTIYFALVAIGGGLGLVISYWIEKKQWLDKQ